LRAQAANEPSDVGFQEMRIPVRWTDEESAAHWPRAPRPASSPAAIGINASLLYRFNIQSVTPKKLAVPRHCRFTHLGARRREWETQTDPTSATRSFLVQLRNPGSPQTMVPCTFGIGAIPTFASAAILPSGLIQVRTYTILNNPLTSTSSQEAFGLLVFGT
jgi:hypothetical protein